MGMEEKVASPLPASSDTLFTTAQVSSESDFSFAGRDFVRIEMVCMAMHLRHCRDVPRQWSMIFYAAAYTWEQCLCFYCLVYQYYWFTDSAAYYNGEMNWRGRVLMSDSGRFCGQLIQFLIVYIIYVLRVNTSGAWLLSCYQCFQDTKLMFSTIYLHQDLIFELCKGAEKCACVIHVW